MSLKSWKLIMMKHFSLLLPFSEKVSSGFINIDNDWLFLQGKSGDWKTWVLNLIHSPASVTRRVRDRASRPRAAPLSHAARLPHTRRKTLLLPLAPAPPCQPWMGCRSTCRTWKVRSWSRGGTAMLPRASSKVLEQVDPAVILRGGKARRLRSQLTYRGAKRLSDLGISLWNFPPLNRLNFSVIN